MPRLRAGGRGGRLGGLGSLCSAALQACAAGVESTGAGCEPGKASAPGAVGLPDGPWVVFHLVLKRDTMAVLVTQHLVQGPLQVMSAPLNDL